MGFDPDQPGPRVWLCQPAGAAPPRGWCLRLRTCLSRFGQAPEGKTLASGGLQGAENLRVVSERGGPVHRFKNCGICGPSARRVGRASVAAAAGRKGATGARPALKVDMRPPCTMDSCAGIRLPDKVPRRLDTTSAVGVSGASALFGIRLCTGGRITEAPSLAA